MRVSDYINQLRAEIVPLSESPLRSALRWWSQQDQYGGFQTVARHLFDLLWVPAESCYAPHREDRRKSFSVFVGCEGGWRCYDFATGQGGTLIDFVMLTGKDRRTACRWLIQRSGSPVDVVLTPEQGEDSQSQSCITYNRPYRLTREELDWQKERAEELWYNKAACKKIAATRGWQVETIEVLAGQRWLGIYGPKLFYLYSTGYKERLRPLDPVKAINFDGEKPFKNSTYCMQSLWRDDCLTEGNDKIVNITEGETDCISGWDKGIEGVWLALPNATTWRNHWRNHWRDSLIGKRIVLWPDNDPAGWRCADRVIEALEPVALSVEVKQKQW